MAVSNLSQNASGLIGLNFENKSSFGFINPTLIRTSQLTQNDINSTVSPAVEMINYRFNF
ncbi:MAG TPA: hypothetical protein DHV30_15115 [Balneola sp.]|nr:hypothetical protein [Balneola sp.]